MAYKFNFICPKCGSHKIMVLWSVVASICYVNGEEINPGNNITTYNLMCEECCTAFKEKIQKGK